MTKRKNIINAVFFSQKCNAPLGEISANKAHSSNTNNAHHCTIAALGLLTKLYSTMPAIIPHPTPSANNVEIQS